MLDDKYTKVLESNGYTLSYYNYKRLDMIKWVQVWNKNNNYDGEITIFCYDNDKIKCTYRTGENTEKQFDISRIKSTIKKYTN